MPVFAVDLLLCREARQNKHSALSGRITSRQQRPVGALLAAPCSRGREYLFGGSLSSPEKPHGDVRLLRGIREQQRREERQRIAGDKSGAKPERRTEAGKLLHRDENDGVDEIDMERAPHEVLKRGCTHGCA